MGPYVLITTICWSRCKFTQVPVTPHCLPDPKAMYQLPFIMFSMPFFSSNREILYKFISHSLDRKLQREDKSMFSEHLL